jgi:AraC-like DNA-binding protein
MPRPNPRESSVAHAWELARAGNLRDGAAAAQLLLTQPGGDVASGTRVELHLVRAFCAMRQGNHGEARMELDAARASASVRGAEVKLGLRVEAWCAELAYLQGRYSEASDIISRLLAQLEACDDWAYVAFALRIRIAILLARAAYEDVAAIADRAVSAAAAGGDDYVMVQVLNILGAVHFDRATSQLREPHARAHLSSLSPADIAPMEDEARRALAYFEQARTVAVRAKYDFAAWYVAGNIERLEILLGRPENAVRAIGKRLAIMQKKGAKYDEIVTRSNLAWALRTLGRYAEALHELDVAFDLARDTGTFNVLLEFLEYDRSIVLDALGDTVSARASYRRYLQLISAWNRSSQDGPGAMQIAKPKRPLEPYFLKRADRFALDHIGDPFSVASMARHCGVSWRTLEKAFHDFRGIAPVAHIRNLRLDRAHDALLDGDVPVAEIAVRFGFASSTTFALEYRKRYGFTPSHAKGGTKSGKPAATKGPPREARSR